MDEGTHGSAENPDPGGYKVAAAENMDVQPGHRAHLGSSLCGKSSTQLFGSSTAFLRALRPPATSLVPIDPLLPPERTMIVERRHQITLHELHGDWCIEALKSWTLDPCARLDQSFASRPAPMHGLTLEEQTIIQCP